METQPKAETVGEQPAPAKPHFADVVAKLSEDIKKRLSTGDLAELRRMRYQYPGCPAFWKLAAVRFDYLDDADVRRWAAIVSGMAAMPELLRANRSLGRALAAAKVAEPRVLRLLRARDDALLDAVRVVSRQLTSAGEPVDWTDLARLVFLDGGARGESVRRRIAGDYYRSVAAPTDQNKGATA
jgi:CRISPR system Cascade subunit CasB